ncbi:ER membrane protein [Colletotrichum truncatum]|uniref:ER membrane protein n=1 Tax=Colletotrichum truncatum TaxID=5467 RepID=A0ACC3Z5I0_COLTU|nr:ER membrane protein [Colletotrichum truncatum]KAF6795237.1 ER membrane protein [Colletotrichum truncatum]
MADFIVKLWESIFTPGPTPTLLIATNVTFAALQSLLFVLLLATYSIHFAILSILSGGLWYSINWFARELSVHAEQEEKKARLAAASGETNAATGAVHTDDSDTEVEGPVGQKKKKGSKPVAGSSQVETEEQRQAAELKRRVAAAAESGAESSNVEGTHSSVSTEDEWEKVSEAENEKDK